MPEPYGAAISAWLVAAGEVGPFAFGERLAGATTATIATCTTHGGANLVVKIYDREIDGVGRPDVERDAMAMIAAAEVDLPVPRLVVADPHGHQLGWPSLVMTRLPGEPEAFGGDDPEAWVDGLADALVEIAAAPLPSTALASYGSWLPSIIERPGWSTRDALWQAVGATLAEGLPSSAPRLIHRDFHQLNVLWHERRPTGTVDWVNGCLGPIESDIASCRVNIALADQRYDGMALADRFLERCLEAGLPWHPLWDLDFIAGVTDRPELFLIGRDLGADLTRKSVQATLETMAAQAVDTHT